MTRSLPFKPVLEPVMREGFVGFRHTVHFFTFFHCAAATFSSFRKLAGKAGTHGFFTAAASSIAQPAHRQRHPAHRPHFNRHLVVGATDTAAFHLNQRFHVIHGLIEHLEGILAAFLADLLQRAVHDPLGDL